MNNTGHAARFGGRGDGRGRGGRRDGAGRQTNAQAHVPPTRGGRGNAVPSSMCLAQQRQQHHVDQPLRILEIDASYKAPKCIMIWSGHKIDEALINEYNEVVVQWYSISDNHDELESNLRELHH